MMQVKHFLAYRQKNQPAAARNFLFAPFPFPRRGKPGRAGSPHAAKARLPPQEG